MTRQQPFWVKTLRPIWAKFNDIALRIHTIPSPPPLAGAFSSAPALLREQAGPQPKYNDSVSYEVSDYLYLRKVCRIVNPSSEDVVYDLGCGMGRFLCVMARRKVRKCVGVELQPKLCQIARRNASRLRRRRAPMEVLCADAAAADLSAGTIYYMYNPFGAGTMREVLANIRFTLSSNPRKISIVYYNSVHEYLFQASQWLEKFHEFATYSGTPVTFWRTWRLSDKN